MPGDYSLSDVLERIYANQLALEATLMELTLRVEQQGSQEAGENILGALETIDENAGYIKQGLARLSGKDLRGQKLHRHDQGCFLSFRDNEVRDLALWGAQFRVPNHSNWYKSCYAPTLLGENRHGSI